jgi:hypothetical protein
MIELHSSMYKKILFKCWWSRLLLNEKSVNNFELLLLSGPFTVRAYRFF